MRRTAASSPPVAIDDRTLRPCVEDHGVDPSRLHGGDEAVAVTLRRRAGLPVTPLDRVASIEEPPAAGPRSRRNRRSPSKIEKSAGRNAPAITKEKTPCVFVT
jgi:hypothetical protein